MSPFSFHRLTDALLNAQAIVWVIWVGMAVLTIALVVLMRTRWGQSKPLRKCVVLSLFAHLLLIAYAATVKIVGAAGPLGEEPGMLVTSVQAVDEVDSDPEPTEAKPWETTPTLPDEIPEQPDPQRPDVEDPKPSPQREMLKQPFKDPVLPPVSEAVEPDAQQIHSDRDPAAATPPQDPADPHESASDANVSKPASQDSFQPEAAPQETPPRERVAAKPGEPKRSPGQRPGPLVDNTPPLPRQQDPAIPLEPHDHLANTADPTVERTPADPQHGDPAQDQWQHVAGPQPASGPTRQEDAEGGSPPPFDRTTDGRGEPIASDHQPDVDSAIQRSAPRRDLPQVYRRRQRADRQIFVDQGGGSPDTEAAVKAALAWLAANQERSGRWNAARHGGLTVRAAGGRLPVDRQDNAGRGMRVDTGVTGLALLAFLGAGYTHQQGQYQENVRAALEYLVGQQDTDGNLYGPAAETFAAMYCHGMATLALAEAYGMTDDRQLYGPLRRAVQYTVSAQNPDHGGWRYKFRDRSGDTSQLGWQLMALKAAEQAGLDIPVSCRHGMVIFLDRVSAGNHRGLARYRPAEATSHVMTAEALFCRLLLGTTPDNPLCDEAGDEILRHLPGQGQDNFYYWYYATLATYQLQGRYWETWNNALQKRLLNLQQRDGSWRPNTRYGGHGGRVYTTAIATLCLEVYYRYEPQSLARRPSERRRWVR